MNSPEQPAAETASDAIDYRLAYQRLLNSDAGETQVDAAQLQSLATEILAGALADAQDECGALYAGLEQPRGDRPASAEALSTLLARLAEDSSPAADSEREWTTAAQRDALLQFAPTALLDGCWLPTALNAAGAHTPQGALLARLYSHELGIESPYPELRPERRRAEPGVRHHGERYRELLERHGLQLSDPRSAAFARHPGLRKEAFELPAVLLAMDLAAGAQHGVELLGLNLLCYSSSPALIGPLVARRLQSTGDPSGFFAIHAGDAMAERCKQWSLELVQLHFENLTEERAAADWMRLLHGVALGLHLKRRWLESALDGHAADVRQDPQARMVALLVNKAPHAVGYHGDLRLGERRIDDWLDPATLQPELLLEALAHSRFIVPGDPAASPLLSELTAFGAPMYAIFSPAELRTIADWIASLERTRGTERPRPSPRSASQGRPAPAAARGPAREARPPAPTAVRGVRVLYHRLLHGAAHPSARQEAAEFVRQRLENARPPAGTQRALLPPRSYSREGCDDWVFRRHRAQVDSYQPLVETPAESRAEFIAGCIQMAPAVLIDGAWLQGLLRPGNNHGAVAQELLHIYFDEIGNGQSEQNHANIFRALLAEMDVELPPIESEEFAHSQIIQGAAYEVPTLWLAISLFPRRYLPETLGINLGVELAGVGGAYREASDRMRHFGFNPHFVELHNVIDNVSSGHTSRARAAIHLYLEDVCARGCDTEVQEHWTRIIAGFHALAPQRLSWPARLRRLFG